MDVKNDILEELRSVSELVATISRETPYRVADDYFTDLPSRLLLRIKTVHKPLAFNVPDGYFEGFAEGVLARIRKEARTGEGARPEFEPMKAVPETASQELSALSPLLAQLRSMETYRMPEGYFEEIAPILTVARELNPYTVPKEYFHHLPAEIEEKVVEPREAQSAVGKKPAKLIAFGGRRTNWWKYSAAAVVAGLILTIGWLRLQVHNGSHPSTVAENIPTSLMKVSDQDLQSFLADQDTTLAQQTNNTASLDFNDSDVRSLLSDVPDGDLRQFMDEHGGAVDIATN
jgi:hypothetical protein